MMVLLAIGSIYGVYKIIDMFLNYKQCDIYIILFSY